MFSFQMSASDQGLNLFGSEEEGDGFEVGGMGETTGRDTVIFLSYVACF